MAILMKRLNDVLRDEQSNRWIQGEFYFYLGEDDEHSNV